MSDGETIVSLELSHCPHCGKELRVENAAHDSAKEDQGVSSTTIFQDYVPEVKQVEEGNALQTVRRPVPRNDSPIRSRAAMIARRRGPRVFGVRPSFVLIPICILVWSIVGIRWWFAQAPVEESVPKASQSQDSRQLIRPQGNR